MKYLVVSIFVFCSSLGFTQTIRFSPENKLFDLPGQNLQLRNPFKPILVGDDPNHWFFGFNSGNCLAYKKDSITGSYQKVSHLPISANLAVLDVRDYNGKEGYEILTDSEIYYFNNTGNYWTYSFFNIWNKVIKGYGDFNNDGKMDFIAEDDIPFEADVMYLMFNKGNNNFESLMIDQSNNDVETMATGDIDNNGHLDFVVTQSVGKPIKFFFNNGDSTFTKKEIASPSGLCCNTLGIELVDMDNDGDLDLLLPGKNNGIFVIKNTNNFSNTLFVSQPQIKDLGDVIMAKAHDFNKDGHMDIVYVIQKETPKVIQLYLLEGKADGTYFPQVLLQSLTNNNQVGFFDGTSVKENLHLVDINRDGHTDITFTSSENKKQIVLYYGITTSTDESPVLENKYFYPTVTYGPVFSVAPEGTTSVVLDIFGRKIMDIHPSEQSVSLDHLGSGTYFIMTYQDGILKGRDRVMVMK